jgi:hypothetical protein
MAFSLVVLVVVVLANARAKATLPGGMDFDIGGDPAKIAAERAADHVAERAEEGAQEVKDAAP